MIIKYDPLVCYFSKHLDIQRKKIEDKLFR